MKDERGFLYVNPRFFMKIVEVNEQPERHGLSIAPKINRDTISLDIFKKQKVDLAGACVSMTPAVSMAVLEEFKIFGAARSSAAQACCLFFNNMFDRQNSIAVVNQHVHRQAVTLTNNQIQVS